MKKPYHLYFLLSCQCFLSSVSAQEESFVAPLVKDSVLLDINTSDFSVVVGERGHVLIARDNQDYSQQVVPTQSTLTAVTVVGDNIWAAGHDAVIIHSADRGVTWEVQKYEPELQRPFLDIVFFDDKAGIAIGAYGLFYRTVDGGKTWTDEKHVELLEAYDQEYLEEVKLESEEIYLEELESILPHLNRVSVNGDELLLAGEAGLLAKSVDQGRTWQRLSVDYYGSFFDIKAVNSPSTALLAVGLRGNAFYAENGVDWQKVQTCSSATLNTLKQIEDDKFLAVGNNGVMIEMAVPFTAAIDAPASACGSLSVINVTQTDEKSAVVSFEYSGDTITAVTADGLKTLSL